MIPTAEEQIGFLTKIQRLLSEGQFTATYKYALLLALADLAVEIGDDSGSPLVVPTELIAEKFIQYYWRHVVPYVPPFRAGSGLILRQNADRQAAVVNHVQEARQRHGDSLPAFKRDTKSWKVLASRVESVFWSQPLWLLQRIATESLDFLYANRPIETRVESIELLPGVAWCLRQFHELIIALVEGDWVQHVRKYNREVLGSTTDLAEFLFGSERSSVALLRPVLTEIQTGRCFYCGGYLRAGGHVDHFIPWSRYPLDLGHNLVVAHDTCNNAKGSMLAAEEHLARWVARNKSHSTNIERRCLAANIGADFNATIQVARWAYGQAFAAGSMTWVKAKELRRIGPAWETLLCSVS
jgi:5-methylcytosine-specific restriction endonuclease McrA